MQKTQTKTEEQKGIGVDVPMPKTSCTDENCPFHGSLKVRGKMFEGIVASAKMRKTASFTLERRVYIRKYQRYEKRLTNIKVHNTDCVSAKEGDKVTIMECRPLSKTKKFVIIRKD